MHGLLSTYCIPGPRLSGLYKHSLTYEPRQWLVLLHLFYGEGTEAEENRLTEGPRAKRQVIECWGATSRGMPFTCVLAPLASSLPPPQPSCKHMAVWMEQTSRL